jgi:hypothetical protein
MGNSNTLISTRDRGRPPPCKPKLSGPPPGGSPRGLERRPSPRRRVSRPGAAHPAARAAARAMPRSLPRSGAAARERPAHEAAVGAPPVRERAFVAQGQRAAGQTHLARVHRLQPGHRVRNAWPGPGQALHRQLRHHRTH